MYRMRAMWVLGSFVVAATVAAAQGATVPATLKSLAGTWEGHRQAEGRDDRITFIFTVTQKDFGGTCLLNGAEFNKITDGKIDTGKAVFDMGGLHFTGVMDGAGMKLTANFDGRDLWTMTVTRKPPKVALRPCAAAPGLPAECGALPVFENRASGRGRRIDIHFAVVRADRPGATTALFMFAGGPGEGSTDMLGMAGGWVRPVRAAMDIVFVDQRGTGGSHPLSCGSPAATRPAAAFGHVFDPAAVAACRAALERDADLTQYTTDLAVADVDDVRAALGYERVSLYGGSYGTRMAQAYMRRFPARVRSAVIDGVVPFDLVIPLTYAASAQQALGRVFAACAAEPGCRAAHPRPAADFARLAARFDAGPIAATVTPPGGAPVTVRMSRGDFGYAVRGMLYGANAVAVLPDRIGRAAASGDVSEFAQFYWNRQVSFDPVLSLGMHLSVFCSEDIPFAAEGEVAAATAGTFLGRYLFDEYRGACAQWRRGPIAADARTPVTAGVPTLLVSGFFDPVTPPQFAGRIAVQLPVSRVVTAPSGAHGSAAGCPRAAVLYVITRGTIDGIPNVCR